MWFLTHIPLNPQVRYKTHDNGYRYVPLTFWYAQITRTCHASQCPTPSKWMNICLGTSGYHFPKAISHNIIELLLWLVAHYPWGKPRVGTTTWHWLWVNPGTCWDVPGISPNDMRQLVDVPNNMGYPKVCGMFQRHVGISQRMWVVQNACPNHNWSNLINNTNIMVHDLSHLNAFALLNPVELCFQEICLATQMYFAYYSTQTTNHLKSVVYIESLDDSPWICLYDHPNPFTTVSDINITLIHPSPHYP